MRSSTRSSVSALRLRALAEFRYQLRQFLHFSESAALEKGLQPQQHQLLLQVAGAPEGVITTIGYVAERMGLRHNSAVELSKRCEDAGLVVRRHDGPDRRCIRLEMTPKGGEMLESLSIDHATELNELAPGLLRTLSDLETARDPVASSPTRPAGRAAARKRGPAESEE